MLLLNLVFFDYFAVGHMYECNQTANWIELVFGMVLPGLFLKKELHPSARFFYIFSWLRKISG